MHRTPRTPPTAMGMIQRFGLRAGRAITLTAVVGLLVGSIGPGLAFRARIVPPFDWQLTLDGMRSVAVHYGPVARSCPV